MWNHSLAMSEKMKEFRLVRPIFQEDELADLLAFLYFLNYFDEPGDPKVGKVLFAEKHCIQCHSLGEEGGNAGPRLDALAARHVPAPDRAGPLEPRAGDDPGDPADGPRRPEVRGKRDHRPLRLPAEPGTAAGRARVPVGGRSRHAAGGSSPRRGAPAATPSSARARGSDRTSGATELRGSVTQLAGRMWNHWPAMSEAMGALGMAPPTFKGEDVADVFAFLFISRYEGRGPAISSAAATIYRQKGCVVCHGEDGQGATSARSLRGSAGEAKEQITQRMWNHAPQMRDQMGAHQIPWPRFDADELAALLALLADGWKSEPASQGAADVQHERGEGGSR